MFVAIRIYNDVKPDKPSREDMKLVEISSFVRFIRLCSPSIL